MVGLRVLVAFCLCSIVIVKTFANDNNQTATLKHELKQLEETVSDLQKHILAQEQKQRPVLSSVLSKLTQTMDELAILQHNYTVLESEVVSLKENYTAVDYASNIGHEVAFEATMAMKGENSTVIKFLQNTPLIFSTTQYNEGGCWNSSNGVFTAPVNGTYIFWINIKCTGVRSLTLFMKKNDADFGKAYGHLDDPKEKTTTSLTSLTPLVRGDRVTFVANRNVNYFPLVSSCGGLLLQKDRNNNLA